MERLNESPYAEEKSVCDCADREVTDLKFDIKKLIRKFV